FLMISRSQRSTPFPTRRSSDLEPEEREIGMVFQDLALWPHMTVTENIAFGLRAKGFPHEQRTRRVSEMVDLVRLGDYLDAKPARSEEHTSELQSLTNLVCRLLL